MKENEFNLNLAVEQGCEMAQDFINKLRKADPRDIGDIRLLDAFLRQIPIPPLPIRPIGADPLIGLGLGIDQQKTIPTTSTNIIREEVRALPNSPIPHDTSHPIPNAIASLLKFIYSGEGGYESYNRGRAGDSLGKQWPGGLQNLTIAEVIELQRLNKIFAVGAAQFIPDTLKIALKGSGLKENNLFSADNQDRLTINLLLGGKRPKLASYLRGASDDLDGAQIELAQEWASIPMPNGKGFYDGDSAGNIATQKVSDVRAALKNAQASLMSATNQDQYFRNATRKFNPNDSRFLLKRNDGIRDRSPEVKQEVSYLQQILVSWHYLSGEGVDGEFGQGTDTAVRNFQKDHGLDIDGEVGEQTWAALLQREPQAITIQSRSLQNADSGRIDNANRLYDAARKLESMDTSQGPDGGNNACVWAVNKVLKQAGIETPWGSSEYVPTVHSTLNGHFPKVDQQRGAIAIFTDGGSPPFPHIGICVDKGHILSNSSSKARFAWRDTPNGYKASMNWGVIFYLL